MPMGLRQPIAPTELAELGGHKEAPGAHRAPLARGVDRVREAHQAHRPRKAPKARRAHRVIGPIGLPRLMGPAMPVGAMEALHFSGPRDSKHPPMAHVARGSHGLMPHIRLATQICLIGPARPIGIFGPP